MPHIAPGNLPSEKKLVFGKRDDYIKFQNSDSVIRRTSFAMPRPKTYDVQAVLDKATEVFWKKGYDGAALEDIICEASFNRHSLYQAFGNKRGLFLKALENYDRTFREGIGKELEAETAGLDTIRKLLLHRLSFDVQGKGCLMTNTINEKDAVDTPVFLVAKRFVERLEEALDHCIRKAQEKGEIPAHKDARSLARFVTLVLQGIGTMSKVGYTETTGKEVIDHILNFLTQP